MHERGIPDGAAQALRTAADAGNLYAAGELATLLYTRGDLDGLRAQVVAGTPVGRFAAGRPARGARRPGGGRAGPATAANAGDGRALGKLADLMYKRGDLDGLRAQVVTGNPWAASRLADLLHKRGDLDGLRARADAGPGRRP